MTMKEGCRILIVPFFGIDSRLADALAEKLVEIFSIPLTFAAPLPLSAAALDPNRGQYRAFELLREACRLKKSPDTIVLGITDRDIYESRLNFVFGLASASMGCAVISTARLSEGFYGMSEDRSIFFRRVFRTHLKNPHRREWLAIGIVTRRKAQGVAIATFKPFNAVRVPIACHPKGRSAFVPSLCYLSSTWLWPRLRRGAAIGNKIASVTAHGDF